MRYQILQRSGQESKHNTACWNQEEYLGFGAAAHSYYNNTRFSNIENLEEYMKNIEDNLSDKNVVIQETQDFDSKAKEYMMLKLRTLEGVDISEFKRKFNNTPIILFGFELKELVEQELVEIDLDRIFITNKGLDFANKVFEKFI